MSNNKVFYHKSWSIQSIMFFALVMLLLSTAPVHAKTGYISDQLKVPLRSGASNGHRILKFLRSGTSFTIVDSENDYTQIKTSDGKTGWVLSENIMDVPSGRDRLLAVDKKLAESRAEVKELKSTVAELKSEIRLLKNDKSELQNERTNLSNSLEDLKITAANPVALSKKNKQLKKDLEKANANVAMLDKDNQQLRSNVTQEWFVIGGAVSMGSLILGIILTRINWRRKRDSWGDSF